MNDRLTRREAMGTATVAAAFLATATCADASTEVAAANAAYGFGKAIRGPDGCLELTLRIIAADDFSPVKGVGVDLVFVGIGADGGFVRHTTDEHGIVRFNVGSGPFQIYLVPPPESRYNHTQFTDIETMLIVQDDGTSFPTQFRIGVRETSLREMRDHVHKKR